MTQRYAAILLFLSLASLAGPTSRLEAQEREPYSLDQVVELIESGLFSDERILVLVRRSCIGFRLDDEATRRLTVAGASEELIAGLGHEDVCVQLPHVVETVVVMPAELDMQVGATGILRAQALAPDSTQIHGVVFEWSSEDTAVAEVSGGGMVLAKAPGEVRITASSEEGPSGTALVRVAVGPAGAEAGAEAEREPGTGAVGGKSVGTAAALGVVIPGGGEFYTGNTGKGLAVLAGSAGALAAGYFITSEEVLSSTYDAQEAPDCAPEGTPCSYSVTKQEEVKETKNLVYGAAAAGALWLYGLIDGIRSAKQSQVPAVQEQSDENAGIALELVPTDGVRYTVLGEVELVFIRIRW